MCKSVRLIKNLLILFIFVFGVAVIVGSSSGGGGDDNDNNGDNTPQTYTASGTYTYNPNTGELIINIINSDFPDNCGPEAGESEDHDVDSVTATMMVWSDDEDDDLTWTRDSGSDGDITGTWGFIDEDGNSYQVTFNADNSISVVAEIVYCDDDDEEDDTPQTHTAIGNYWYNPDTGMLVLTFILSDFVPGCGPEVGDENQNVDSITATTMHWVEDDMTWTRDSGTAGDILGTWDWVDEDGNSYEITFNNDFSMSVVAEIVDCDDIDASGTWDLAFTIDLAGVDTNFLCIPGDSEGDNTRDATIVINETGDNTFTMSIDGNIINGTISGGVYTFAGSWIDPDPDGPYTINISGSFTLNSSDNLTGSDEFNGTNGEGNYCTWDETFIGTKQ